MDPSSTFPDALVAAGGELLVSAAAAAPYGALIALVIPLATVLFQAAVATVAIVSAPAEKRSEVSLRILNALLGREQPPEPGA